MHNLGDLFPEELKEQVTKNSFKIGTVIKRFETSTNPPKYKRSVVIGFDAENVVFAHIFINTQINPKLFPTQDLKDLHIEFDTAGRDYLSHSSFVDCSQIHEDNIEAVKALIASDSSACLGEVSEQDLVHILTTIKLAKTISKNKKKKFGLL